MRALYDSEADALQIELEECGPVDYDEDATGSSTVGIIAGRVVGVEVLGAAHLEGDLDAVAGRYGLDREALLAAGRSAVAAHDREVVLEVSPKRAE